MKLALLIALILASARPVPPINVTSSRPRPPATDPRLACTAGRALAGAQLMVVGHYENAALATAWVGNVDEETSIASFHVAHGPPIHLVITGQGQNIYRFTGATARIRRLTLMGTSATAAIGIPRGRVEFSGPCLRHDLFYGRDLSRREAAVRRHYGRAATIAGAYSLLRVRIGRDIAIERLPLQNRLLADPETAELLRFSPGGLVRVDPRRLVSNVRVGAYRTLPQEAGVRQLVRSGALVRATEADARNWEAQARRRGVRDPRAVHGLYYGVYRVTRPILVPAGLCGAHLIRLYVPSPAYIRGNACHSTLYFDDGTGSGPMLR